MNGTVTAADLLGFRLCTGQCLLGLEEQCVCRCRGRWHAVLAGAEIPVPPGLTLADALAGGPAGGRSRKYARGPSPASGRQRGPVTFERVRAYYAAELAAGELPSVRRIRRDLKVGQPKAQRVQAQLAAVMNGGHVPEDN